MNARGGGGGRKEMGGGVHINARDGEVKGEGK